MSLLIFGPGGQEIYLKLGHQYKKSEIYLQVVGSYGYGPTYILQLSKRSVIYSGSDAVSKLQKGDVMWGRIIQTDSWWPDLPS